MTDRPIIFSAPMIRALIDSRKTQTRRLVRSMPPAPSDGSLVHPPKHDHCYFDAYCGGKKSAANPRGMTENWCWWTRDDRAGHGCRIGYVPSDRLWVREAWRADVAYDDLKPSELGGEEGVRYETDGRFGAWTFGPRKLGRYRHGRFMPRWASRLTLIVEEVRVEPLEGISRDDAIAEGLIHQPGVIEPDWWMLPEPHHQGSFLSPVAAYRWLWNDLHTKPGERWEDNPHVVALTFRVEQRNIDAGEKT